jgi:hypothetical protein
MNPKKTVAKAMGKLRGFIGTSQLEVLGDACRGEEGTFFRAKLAECGERVSTMPKTYEQDGKGHQAVVHLHYFAGACDWWITERDVNPDGEGQTQAFGLASLGHEPELGYICIPELLEAGAELDLYWTPKTLKEVRDLASGRNSHRPSH